MTVEQHETFVKRDIHHGSLLALFWLYCVLDVDVLELYTDFDSAVLCKEDASDYAKKPS